MNKEKKDHQWYAVYTAPRAEKKVRERFLERGIEHYLPIRIVESQWHDRVKKIEQPVINGYIFVYVSAEQMPDVLGTYGAIAFVRERSRPVPIPVAQMEVLKQMVDKSETEVEFSVSDIPAGTPVRINSGNLCGMIGELVEVKGKHKVLVRMDGLGCALTTVSNSCIEVL